MNIQEQLRSFRQKRNEASERQLALMSKAADEDRTLDADESSEHDGLDTEIKHIDSHIARLEKHVAAKGNETEVKGTNRGPTIIVKTQDPDDKFPGQSYVRRLIAKAVAYNEMISGNGNRTAAEVAHQRWGKTHPNLVRVIKAGIAGGGTDSGEWGAELVQADSRYTGDFIQVLDDATVFYKLPLREVPAHVTIKGSDGVATGNWVGESKAIPVSLQDYSTVSLEPLKVAAISVVSNELLKHSSPSAELLVRDRLIAAAAERIDTTFVSATAASSNVSPAGILNGLSSLGSNGWDGEAVRQDIRELYAPFLTAKHASGLILLMTPTRAKATSLLVNTLGQTEFANLGAQGGTLLGDRVITGDNVGATTVILVDPSEIWRIGDTGIEVSMSRDATLEQDGAPQGASDTPTAASATLMSMFQTESTAFKIVRPINYQKRRSTAASFISDAAWGESTSTTA